MLQRLYVTLFRLLPLAFLSRCVGALTRSGLPRFLHRGAIRAFATCYGIDVEEAELPVEDFPTFGDFFTRRLKAGVRPIDPTADAIVSPVDATIGAMGPIEAGTLIQAKGRNYTLAALLDDPAWARRFEGGSFLTLYLSPRDYHRIHSPFDGQVEMLRYIPGRLFPVNGPAVRSVPNLFCVNERVISYLRSEAGAIAVVKVGATCVGRIRVTYDPLISNTKAPAQSRAFDPPRPFAKGAELGHFELGSTVVLVFEAGRVAFDPNLRAGDKVRMGRKIAQRSYGNG